MSSANNSNEVPSGQVSDPSYKTKGTEAIPVVDDNAPVEDGLLPEEADSDRQLAKDDTEAIDESNIIEEKTRHAKPKGTYQEPGDEEKEFNE